MGLAKNEGMGPSWGDVADLIGDLEKEFKGRIVVEMGKSGYGKRLITIDVAFRRVRGRADWFNVVYRVASFPSHRSRTMSGVLVSLLWELREAITEYDDLPLFNQLPPETCPLPPPQG